MSVLCAVAGGSGSGKTTLCRQLAEYFGPETAVSLSYDAYYRDQRLLSPAERRLVNYDHPDSLDTELFVEHLKALKEDRSIEIPVYDFATHTRGSEATVVAGAALVLVDGILALHTSELRRLYDLTVFVDTPSELRLQRRTRRDVGERGRDLPDVHRQWQATVEPMFDQFVAVGIDHADIVATGIHPFPIPGPGSGTGTGTGTDDNLSGSESDPSVATMERLVRVLTDMVAERGTMDGEAR